MISLLGRPHLFFQVTDPSRNRVGDPLTTRRSTQESPCSQALADRLNPGAARSHLLLCFCTAPTITQSHLVQSRRWVPTAAFTARTFSSIIRVFDVDQLALAAPLFGKVVPRRLLLSFGAAPLAFG